MWQHKTSGNFGSANIVLPETQHRLICDYIKKHRATPADGFEEYVFLTPQGKKVAQISAIFSATGSFSSNEMYNFTHFQDSTIRK